jgi:hypothetical protein
MPVSILAEVRLLRQMKRMIKRPPSLRAAITASELREDCGHHFGVEVSIYSSTTTSFLAIFGLLLHATYSR